MSNESNQNSESNNQLFLQDPLKFDQYSQISEDLSPLYEDLSTGRPTGLNGSESKKSVIVGNNNPLVALGKLGEISRTNSILSSIGESLPITSPLSASTPVFTSFSAGITQFFNPNAPALITSIEGINFDENANNTGFFQIPPDPSGAAGLNHVVSVVNSSIEWHTKTGIQQNSQSLRNFFSAAVPGTTDDPLTGTFDPKVIYDQYSNRFVVVTLEQQGRDGGINNPSNDRSRIYVAVSDDADPNGTWFGYSINSLVNIGGTNYWADYPGFAVGQDAVYITNNVFKFDGDGAFGGSRLWVIPKTPFYSGGTPSNTIYDPSTLAGLGFQLGTLQPAHTFGTTPGNTGTFLVSTSVNTSVGGNDFVDVIRIDNPLGGPSFNYQAINVGDINTAFSLPGAPQSGTSTTVSTNDQRALNAVWRNNNLYLTNTVAPPSGPDAGQATAHWYQINTTNLNALTLADQGNIGGEDIAPNTSTFFPSIAVNSVGDVGIGFSASAATIFPGAYYTGRKASDLAGTVQSSGLLRAGQDSYVRTFGGPRNRWGDYSGASVDPSNDSFWVFNEYALTRGNPTAPGDDGRWGTAFGNFSLAATKTISIAKTTDGNEAGSVSSVFTLTRTGDLSSALTVNYTLAGTATPGVDYTGTTPNTVTFAALSPTATITLPTIDDLLSDPSETIITKITAPVGYTISGPDNATATILDNDGNAANNNLVGTSFADALAGVGGNDTLDGGAGNDTLDGGADNDTYLFDTGLVLGSDRLIDASGIDTLNFAATTTKTINLNLGSTAAQTVTAGNLTLTLASATAFENVIGGSLNDNIVGNSLANSLTGGAGNDTLSGLGGNDTLDGGANNDTYLFDTDLVLGSDRLIDASGIDTLNFAATTTKTINLNLGSTAAQTVTAGNLTLTLASATAFENVIGGSLNDTIVGNSLANSLTGEAGNDSLTGGLGNDTLDGGLGNDTLNGGADNDTYLFDTDLVLGSDRLIDASGIDTLNFAATTTKTINLNLGSTAAQTVTAGNLTLTLASATAFENVIGGSLNDNIVGNTLNNSLTGGLGKDSLTGSTGLDTLNYNSLGESLLSGFDVIQGYSGTGASLDRINAPAPIAAITLTASKGTASSLTEAAIQLVLTNAAFAANTAAAFTVTGQSGTFIALNNEAAGFQAASDAIIQLSGYNIAAATPVVVI
ncbi:beta strand repeat-containing protein [Microcystis aeruginosa FACHB-524]|uniref:beta strand repeat-containing protein n=1 Tax=Microcystis aeruginosa TaxID=1126 RepID=UPI000F45103E|nr:M10 family metallopeptidase C-terminal domain-containing protein [Microcystis aeruginosa]ROI12780.1 hemolysin [Microcystis aeruginosa FACHB-524]